MITDTTTLPRAPGLHVFLIRLFQNGRGYLVGSISFSVPGTGVASPAAAAWPPCRPADRTVFSAVSPTRSGTRAGGSAALPASPGHGRVLGEG